MATRGVIKLTKGSKRPQWDLKPSSIDWESGLLTGMPSHPTYKGTKMCMLAETIQYVEQ